MTELIRPDWVDDYCTQCAKPVSLTMDSPGVSHHLTDEGEIDYDQDADHVALVESIEGYL